MSHFTVLVTGEDIDSALAPFIERNEDEESKQYFTFNIELTKAELQAAYEASEDKSDYATVEDYALDYHGYALDDDGNAGYFRNPNAKWDWYLLGGRWTGYLKLKSGATGEVGRPGLLTGNAAEGYADSALIRDIDFDGMRDKAVAEATEYATPLLNSLVGVDMYKTWDSLYNSIENNDEVRTTYQDQKAIKTMKTVNSNGYNFDHLFTNSATYKSIADNQTFTQEDVDGLINDYKDYAGKSSLSTFAFLHDGKWAEHGEMGWFGTVSNEQDGDAWLNTFNAFIASLPDDTRINIVDCHI
jgi:hypothetical protein